MSNVVVGNPTSRAKAVRIAGGHAIIEAGKSMPLTLQLSAAELQRYTDAGLTFSDPQAAEVPKPAPAAAKPAAAQVPQPKAT